MKHEIDKQCSYDYCKINDFLPFLCRYCKKFFCINHQNAEDHECIDYLEIKNKIRICDDKKIAIKNDKDLYVVCEKCKALIKIDENENRYENSFINNVKEIYEKHEINECKNNVISPKYCSFNECIYNKYCINSNNNRKCIICQKIFCFNHVNAVNHNCEEMKKKMNLKKEEIKLKFQKRISSNTSSTVRDNIKSEIVNDTSNEKKKKLEEKIFRIKIKLTSIGLTSISESSRIFVKLIIDNSLIIIKNSFQIEKKTCMFKNRSVNIWLNGDITIGNNIELLSEIFKAVIFSKNENNFFLYKILKYRDGKLAFNDNELYFLDCSSFCRNVLSDGDTILIK
ncbi:AN1-like zinc finger, putative [Plasmodium gallinaceum]|uniref:AN1-like zinc finger, putative n=1 Tax=Plasmodium gallinaceum TaxID=5849 RepID=A0A1J1GM23_PLAGA|nr:AN1-like zinc finger, putative [Plasmodium gallinaceum]CRG93285.1 AN1-like zinc finger, putative [Plasmodium gallinaceum]